MRVRRCAVALLGLAVPLGCDNHFVSEGESRLPGSSTDRLAQREAVDLPCGVRGDCPQTTVQCPRKAPNSVDIEAIEYDDNLLYVALRHRAGGDDVDRKLAVTPNVSWTNGSARGAPTFRGVVRQGAAIADTLEIELRGIPDGQVDVAILALGTSRIIPLHKQKGSIRYLKEDERYHVDEAGMAVTGSPLSIRLGE